MKDKKYTTTQRIKVLENVVGKMWGIVKDLQDKIEQNETNRKEEV